MTISKDSNGEQYSLIKILTIWAVVAIPMPLMAFWIAPAATAATAGLNMNPLLLIWLLLIGGMIWQFILSVGLLCRPVTSAASGSPSFCMALRQFHCYWACL
jgi:hypothetical protein